MLIKQILDEIIRKSDQHFSTQVIAIKVTFFKSMINYEIRFS